MTTMGGTTRRTTGKLLGGGPASCHACTRALCAVMACDGVVFFFRGAPAAPEQRPRFFFCFFSCRCRRRVIPQHLCLMFSVFVPPECGLCGKCNEWAGGKAWLCRGRARLLGALLRYVCVSAQHGRDGAGVGSSHQRTRARAGSWRGRTQAASQGAVEWGGPGVRREARAWRALRAGRAVADDRAPCLLHVESGR